MIMHAFVYWIFWDITGVSLQKVSEGEISRPTKNCIFIYIYG
jgi:hypothetical protein